MIILLLGGTDEAQHDLAGEMLNDNKARAQKLYLGHIDNTLNRHRRLIQELRRAKLQKHTITILHGVSSAHEIAACREFGANVVHLYGALNKTYAHSPIHPLDVQICPWSRRVDVPSHVLTPTEAISVFALRADKAERLRRQQRHNPRKYHAMAPTA